MDSMIMHPDTFFLFCALESDGILTDDPALLTFYRVHQSTTNHFALPKVVYFSEKSKYYGRTESDWRVIRSFLRKEENAKLCDCETLHNSIFGRIYGSQPDRFGLFQDAVGLVKCIRTRRFVNMFFLTMVSFLIFLFPVFGRHLFFVASNLPNKQS